MGRSRSGSSSSSSSSSGSDRGHKVKKDKKDKKKDKGDKHKDDKGKDKKHKEEELKIPGIGKLPGPAGQLLGALIGSSGKREAEQQGQSGHGGYAHQQVPVHGQPPLMPAYTQQQPQHGYGGDHGSGRLDPNRLPPYARALSTHNPLPPPNEVGYAACSDTDGSPLFLVLVPHNGGLHPGKMVIRPGANHPEIYFSYGGGEISHSGEYALVPFDPQRMHWVPASRSEVLYGARPVDAGYEEDGAPLHFALGIVNGGRVPGKAGRHLGGASVPYNGGEHHSEHPEILCWI